MKPDKVGLYISEKLQQRKLPTLRHMFSLQYFTEDALKIKFHF
jgi:hypothetical protein